MAIGVVAGTLCVLSSVAWPIAWLGLELNLICFVPLVIKEESLKKTCMLYFVTQSIGSLLIVAAGLLTDFNSWLQVLLLFGLVLKMGAMPIHFWVPIVVPRLRNLGVYTIQTWQKVAPFGLIIFVVVNKELLSLLNVWIGAFSIGAMSAPIIVVIFSGIVQIGWIFSISSGLLWWFIIIYFIVIRPVVKYIKTNSGNFRLALINGGGLPPFTGFVIKLNAVKTLSSKIGALMIAGRGVALLSYTRTLLNLGYQKDKLSRLVLLRMVAGIV